MSDAPRASPPWPSFQAWAEAQFGPRPKAPDREAVLNAEERARLMRAAYEARRAWDEKIAAAIYAWNVRDEQKGRKVTTRG